MNRTLIAIAATVLTAPALFASAAQACISCEYVPEVVRDHTTDRPAVKQRSYVVEKPRSTYKAKKQIVKRAPATKQVDKVDKVDTAAIKKPAKTEAAPAAEAATETAEVAPDNENSSISVASTDAAPAAKPAVSTAANETVGKSVDCKKFFPSVGMTLTVPCE